MSSASDEIESADTGLDSARWRVWFTSRESAAGLASSSWLDDHSIPEGMPFLIAPNASFDVELNSFFETTEMMLASWHTRAAYARDLAGFLSFAAVQSGVATSRIWRSLDREDRRAYYFWRNESPNGPRVSATTWNRETATVSKFFRWAVEEGYVDSSPIRMRETRSLPSRRGRAAEGSSLTSAERRPDHGRESIQWMTGSMYRIWRDVGIRGYGSDGLRDGSARRSVSGRDSAFTDLMIRTGLRLTEQASLSLVEIPARTGKQYVAGQLPSEIAKNGSGRKVYFPDSVLASLEAYVRGERDSALKHGRSNNAYVPNASTWILEDPSSRVCRRTNGGRIELSKATPRERQEMLVEGEEGLSPAALWLGRRGLLLAVHSWQRTFQRASDRCQSKGVNLKCSPHMLRHSFAVITLEQLQRGHNDVLAARNPDQRSHYQMVFGDPLNWVRIRLGHKSIETTLKYLHALAELEMETKLALLGDDWSIDSLAGMAESMEGELISGT